MSRIPWSIVIAIIVLVMAQPGVNGWASERSPEEAGLPSGPAANRVDPEVEVESERLTVFQRIAGSTFHPRESDDEVTYGGSGCVYATAGTVILTADLQVPSGSEIDYLRAYFYDTSSGNVETSIFSFDGAGNYSVIAEADSSGTPGWDSAGSGFFSHFVDNIGESLAFTANLTAAGSGLMFCGVRIRYQRP